MRMKMFAAESFDAAKALIFAEMGDDAIILSEREVEGGVEVRAAIDKSTRMNDDPMFLSLDDKRPTAFRRENPLRQRVRDSLLWHGAPTSFAERIAESAGMEAEQGTEPGDAMARGLSVFAKFDPLPAMPDSNIILVGPPGHGRTSVAAKADPPRRAHQWSSLASCCRPGRNGGRRATRCVSGAGETEYSQRWYAGSVVHHAERYQAQRTAMRH